MLTYLHNALCIYMYDTPIVRSYHLKFALSSNILTMLCAFGKMLALSCTVCISHVFSHRIGDVNAISSLAINQSADWVALGSSATGALCVWEWQSESFQLKQQSHFGSMACLAYSPDGQYIATGGDDAKVWFSTVLLITKSKPILNFYCWRWRLSEDFIIHYCYMVTLRTLYLSWMVTDLFLN